jgi:hypothetical protein
MGDRFIDEALANATERQTVLERDLGRDFDPLKLEEDDAAHVAVLRLADRVAQEQLETTRLTSALQAERLKSARAEAEHIREVTSQSEALLEAIDRDLAWLTEIRRLADGRSWWSRIGRRLHDLADRMERSLGRIPAPGWADKVMQRMRDEERCS